MKVGTTEWKEQFSHCLAKIMSVKTNEQTCSKIGCLLVSWQETAFQKGSDKHQPKLALWRHIIKDTNVYFVSTMHICKQLDEILKQCFHEKKCRWLAIGVTLPFTKNKLQITKYFVVIFYKLRMISWKLTLKLKTTY